MRAHSPVQNRALLEAARDNRAGWDGAAPSMALGLELPLLLLSKARTPCSSSAAAQAQSLDCPTHPLDSFL